MLTGNEFRRLYRRQGASSVLLQPCALGFQLLFAHGSDALHGSFRNRGLAREASHLRLSRVRKSHQLTSQRFCGAVCCRIVLAFGVQELASAFAGGSVGVLGTLVTLEVLQSRARERKQCPYCSGRGKLVCGRCFALGSLPSARSPGGVAPCQVCGHTGYVPCNHCDGTGRMFPGETERAVLHAYEQEWLGEEP
jgi:hypothetical protein